MPPVISKPNSGNKSANKTIKFAKSLPLDYAQFSITIIKPHSELEKENFEALKGIDYWREYIRGTVEEKVLPAPWTNLSRAESESLARKAYLHFYFRPKYIWKMVTRVESFRELLRYTRVFFQLLLRPIRPQNGKKMFFLNKIGRCALAFTEALIAALNYGHRHPVAAYGGGLKGAWKLAKHEWEKSTILEDLPSTRNDEKL